MHAVVDLKYAGCLKPTPELTLRDRNDVSTTETETRQTYNRVKDISGI